jgi:hypothetical protein
MPIDTDYPVIYSQLKAVKRSMESLLMDVIQTGQVYELEDLVSDLEEIKKEVDCLINESCETKLAEVFNAAKR